MGDLDFSPDGSMVATTGKGKLVLWNTRTGKRLRETGWKNGTAGNCRFVDKGKGIACTGGEKLRVYLLDAQTLKTRVTIDPPMYEFCDMESNPAGDRFASMLSVSKVFVWDGKTAKKLCEINYSGGGGISNCAFDPLGKVIAIGFAYKDVIQLCDAATGKELRKLTNAPVPFSGGVRGIAFDRDGTFVAAVFSRECAVRGWSPSTGALLWRLSWKPVPRPGSVRPSLPEGEIDKGGFAIAVSPDGATVAVVCDDLWVRLYEVATGGVRFEMALPAIGITFSPDGKLLGSLGQTKGELCLWDWHRIEGKPQPRPQPAELDRLWADLGDKDAAVGFRAVAALAVAPADAEVLLAARLRQAPAATSLRRLMADLGDDYYRVRQRAEEDLEYLGKVAEPLLREAAKRSPSLQVKRTAQAILRRLDGVSELNLRARRGTEILEYLRTPPALWTLQRLAKGADGAIVTDEAKKALRRLGDRSKGEPESR